ncbi:MAG: N-acetylglucosamine kinase [Bacteroidota bacterium]|nr:N-acetylglucosamine kinase [Bacteroidota bacterium]
MPTIKLIADSGSTKTEWCLLNGKKKTIIVSQGMSPYFINGTKMEAIIANEVVRSLKTKKVDEIYFYGTGCSNPENARMVKKALKNSFADAKISVETDVAGAAKGLCGNEKGIACILGTGSSSCYYNGKRIVKNSPGLGYVLGDEGSGAYLGKKVIQHFLYNIFDEDLRARFDAKFVTTANEILNAVYKEPLANRYLATFAIFLAENRGNSMIENIIEDGFNDFFHTQISKYPESFSLPIHFTGGIAFGFHDVLAKLCKNNRLQLGNVLKNPMEGLIKYHGE